MVAGTVPSIAIDARLAGGSSTGDSTYWTGLLRGLERLRPDFRFLLISNAPKPASIPDSLNFEWVVVPASSSRVWSLLRFPLAARRLGARALHTQYTLSPLAINGITTIHDVSFFVGPEWFRPRDQALLRASIPASVRRAARVITVSETSRKEIEAHIPTARGKIRVTYPAAHPEIRTVERQTAKARVAAELGIDGPFLLTVGTRWPRKNMALALEAVELLPESVPHKLLVTGKPGWGEERMGGRAVATGYVSFELLSCIYSAADLYLAPSRHEGFGIPVIEAFQCGCPVLCSAGGALPETAGDAALVEPSWSPETWADTIQRLLGDSSNLTYLRARGFERAKNFTWEETARRTLKVYREVLG